MQHMENRENDSFFDDIIRQSMQQMEANADQKGDNSPAPDFDLFEKRLRRVEENDDEAFDYWIRKAAERQDVPFKAAHWTRMEQLLEETFSWKRYIVRFKIPELVLSGLAIWTFFNVFEGSFPQANVPNKVDLKAQSVINQSITPANPLVQDKVMPIAPQAKSNFNQKADWNQRAGDAPLTKDAPVKIENKFQFKGGGENAPQAAIENPNLPVEKAVEERVNHASSVIAAMLPTQKGTDLSQQPILNDANLQRIESENKSNGIAINDLNIDKKNIELVDAIAMIQPELLKAESTVSVPVSLRETPVYKPRRVRIGMFGAFNADQASTFYSALSIGGKSVTDGYGAGVTAGYRKGKTEIESSLTYSYKSYRPVEAISITGTFGGGYERTKPKLVAFNMVHIPIHMNRYLLEKQKWSIYGIVGGSANGVLQTDYDIETNEPVAARVSDNTSFTKQAIKEFYSGGLLESGQLKDNYYFTANVGTGIEYHPTFRGRWSLFAQALYQQHIGKHGTGTNQDKISTFSVQVGAKARL
ncbi:MAG: hypothetical protein RL329_695 [Bacteroidota bacterium]